MDDDFGKATVLSWLRRCGALTAAMLLALAGAGCDPDKQAVPDPDKPPLPKTAQHQ